MDFYTTPQHPHSTLGVRSHSSSKLERALPIHNGIIEWNFKSLGVLHVAVESGYIISSGKCHCRLYLGWLSALLMKRTESLLAPSFIFRLKTYNKRIKCNRFGSFLALRSIRQGGRQTSPAGIDGMKNSGRNKNPRWTMLFGSSP